MDKFFAQESAIRYAAKRLTESIGAQKDHDAAAELFCAYQHLCMAVSHVKNAEITLFAARLDDNNAQEWEEMADTIARALVPEPAITDEQADQIARDIERAAAAAGFTAPGFDPPPADVLPTDTEEHGSQGGND